MNTISTTMPGGIVINTSTDQTALEEMAFYISTHIEEWGTRPVVWDLRRFNFQVIHYQDVSFFLSKVGEAAQLRERARTAMVVDSALGHGISRMIMSVADGRGMPLSLSTFTDYERALDWVRES